MPRPKNLVKVALTNHKTDPNGFYQYFLFDGSTPASIKDVADRQPSVEERSNYV